MTESHTTEGARWFLILACSLVAAILVWPAFSLLILMSPIPVNLFTAGVPASVITGGAFVLVGQYVSRHGSLATSKALAITFTLLAALMLVASPTADRPEQYAVMGLVGPVGAWLAHSKVAPDLARFKRRE